MQDDLITPLPSEDSQAQPAAPATDAEADSQPESERIFDITDDNIAPAVDEPVRVFEPKAPASQPQQTSPARPMAAPVNLPISPEPDAPTPIAPIAPAAPVVPPALATSAVPATPKPPLQQPGNPFPPSQPRQPLNIPLSDFTQSLKKAAAPAPSFAAPIPGRPIPGNVPNTTAGDDFFPKAADLKALRTYEGDVAEVLAHSQASRSSIAIAEARKESGEDRIQNEEPSHVGRNLLLTVLSLLILVAGAGGAYYLYSQSALAPSTPQAPVVQSVPSLIPADSQDVISIDGLSAPATLARIQSEIAKQTPPNSITEIIPIETLSGQKTRVSASEMLGLMEITPPDILSRSLDSPWMLGVYTGSDGAKSAFIVATTNFFQNAFAGMLQWESVMADDLKQYVGTGSAAGIANVAPAPAPAVAIASSTGGASTTASAAGLTAIAPVQPAVPNTVSGHFEDRIILNKDVRVFVTNDGKTLFLYSFIDNTKLAVAGSEAALREILTRLENQAYVR